MEFDTFHEEIGVLALIVAILSFFGIRMVVVDSLIVGLAVAVIFGVVTYSIVTWGL